MSESQILSRPMVIYHANCVDGFSAAWAFWHKVGDAYDYVPVSYGKAPPDVTGRRVYLVDFCFPIETLREMARQAEFVLVLDHHKSAEADLVDVARFAVPVNGGLLEFDELNALQALMTCDPDCRLAACFDMQRSGATLAWDFINGGEPRPPLLGYVEDRDLWRFKLPNCHEIQADTFSWPQTFDVWERLMSADAVGLLKMTASGAAIRRKADKDIADAVRSSRRLMTIGGHEVPVASVPSSMASDAGHILAEGAPFAATYYDHAEGRNFSLRSRPEGLDVSAIAQQYGGGGHEHAAGFRVPRDHELARC